MERRCSAYTVRNYRQAFEDLYRWLSGSGLWSRGPGGMASREVRDFVIEAQRRFDRRTLHNHVSGLRTFYRYWQRKGRLARNPFVGAALPKLEKRLPKFLTEEQMLLLLSGPQRLLDNGSLDAFTAWRDRLAIELLYGGGLRVSELVGLNHGSVDESNGVARVLGKGRKERLCPLGRTALAVYSRFKTEHSTARGPADPDPGDPRRPPHGPARRAADAEEIPRACRAPPRHVAPQAEARLRHAPSERRRGSARRAGTFGARQARYDPGLHARRGGEA